MRHCILTSLAILFACCSLPPVIGAEAHPADTQPHRPSHVPGQLVVLIKGDIDLEHVPDLLSAASPDVLNVEPIYSGNYPAPEDSDVHRLFYVHFPPTADIFSVAELYGALPFVTLAEPDYVGRPAFEPNDPYFYDQWGLQKIQADDAYDINTGSADITIAVLDTGCDLDHEDLIDKLLTGYDFEYDDPEPDDVFGHGTKVAGIAAATDNMLGIAASCPNCTILPLKVCSDDGVCYGSIFRLALAHIRDNQNADVINISIGWDQFSSLTEAALNECYDLGIYSVAAAGNEDNDIRNYPAAYDNVIGVAATNTDDSRRSNSCYGNWVDIAAPGTGIRTTLINDNYTSSASGTSYSTPFAAGLMGLIRSRVREGGLAISFEEIRQLLIDTSDPVTGFPAIQGGRINSYEALLATPYNHAPSLQPVEDWEGVEEELLIIDLHATDEDADTLLYATNADEILPSRFTFDTETGIFEWTPRWNDAGVYEVEFSVTDGFLWDADTTTLTVLDAHSALTEPTETSGLHLRQPCPSPTPTGTRISFYSPDPAPLHLKILDVRGRLVRNLLTGSRQTSGWSEHWWDGRDQNGERVPSGIYFCILDVGTARLAKDITVVR